MNSIPENRKYSRLHIWIEMEDEFIGRCGVTEEYLDSMGTIEFIEFPEIDMAVRMGEKVGAAESGKAFLAIHSPVSGRIVELNNVLEKDPSILNSDPCGNGWIYKIDVKEPGEFRDLMDEDRYLEYLEDEGDI